MAKVIQVQTKQSPFRLPSIEVTGRIDDSDKVSALNAAAYRFSERFRELEHQFQVKAAALRQEYLDECATAVQGSEAAE